MVGIIDTITAFTWITVGFAVGFMCGVLGLGRFFYILPHWLRIVGTIVIITGIMVLFAYFRPDKIEGIKEPKMNKNFKFWFYCGIAILCLVIPVGSK